MPIAFLFKLACLILWRSWRATVVVASMIILAVGVLVFLIALATGASDAMVRNSTGLYAGHIVGSGMSRGDVQRLQVPHGKISGVKQILVRQHMPVLLQSDKGMESADLIGVSPSQEKQAVAYWKKTVNGTYLKAGEETIFLSETTLQRLQAKLGDEVSVINPQGIYLKKLRIGGVYRTGIAYLDNGVVFCSEEAMPPGEVAFTVAIFLEEGVSLEASVAHYKSVLPSVAFSPWTEFMPDLKQLIDLNDFCMNILIALVFAIVAVGVSCTFLIFTLKNLREHGIMKAMGFMPRDTALLLLMQIGLLTLAAAVLGTCIGTFTAWVFSRSGIDISTYISHNQYFAVSGVLYPRLTGLALFAPAVVAVFFSLLAALWPIIYVLRRNPADILRSV